MSTRIRTVRTGRRRRAAGALAGIALGALLGGAASAETSSYNDRYEVADEGAMDRVGPSLQQSFADLDAMLFPPWELEQFAPIDDTASCETLYAELNQRVPKTYSYRAKFSDNPINSVIAGIGTMWWPAWLLWIIPEVARYRENRHVRNNRERVAHLRDLSAAKECWVK